MTYERIWLPKEMSSLLASSLSVCAWRFWISRSYKRERSIFIANSRFLCWLRSAWHPTTMLVGMCVVRIADSTYMPVRPAGKGGQNDNQVETATHITHTPTNIVVGCQAERSQHTNRELAMKMLRSRLYDLEIQKRQAHTDKLDESKLDISFGSQIRSYVMQPYRLIKDHRTKFEVGDVDRVMDGDLDPFIRSYLMAKKSKGKLDIEPDDDADAA